MGQDWLVALLNILKMFAIFMATVAAVPQLVWLERRGSAFIQNRFGPNRVGPMGLTQLMADAVKFLFKESFRPARAIPILYYAAPVIAIVPAALALGAIPLGPAIHFGAFDFLGHHEPFTFALQSFDIGVGIVFVLGVSSLSAYALMLAGYGSGSKYPLFGAIRASAQTISYELALSLSLVGMIILYGTLSFNDMVAQQAGPLAFMWFGHAHAINWIPNWGIFYNPIGFIIFVAATFAESNRLPFDLPEAESELVAGYHTEYGGFNMLMFYIGEYGHMIVASLLVITFYGGGYNLPLASTDDVLRFWVSHVSGDTLPSVLTGLTGLIVILAKLAVCLWVFVWVRWSLPRFRYDQLMNLGWKTMLPWALANTVATAVWMALMHA